MGLYMIEKLFAVSLAGVLALAGTASAHHSGAMYDSSKKDTLRGVVTDFEWTNPHAWLQVEVVDPASKKTARWVFESLGTNQLTRAGWTRNSIKPGDQAVVVYNPLHDGDPGGRLVSVSVNGKPVGGEDHE